jgi:hypothetical protein
MREFLVASIELLAYLVGTGVLAVAGVAAELSSLSYHSAGNTTFALWLAVIGAVALYAAFSLSTDKLLPRLRDRTA